MNQQRNSELLKKLQLQKDRLEQKIRKLTVFSQFEQDGDERQGAVALTARNDRDMGPVTSIEITLNDRGGFADRQKYKSINYEKQNLTARSKVDMKTLVQQKSQKQLGVKATNQAPSKSKVNTKKPIKRPNTQMQVLDQQLNSAKQAIRAEKSKERLRRKPDLPPASKVKSVLLKKNQSQLQIGRTKKRTGEESDQVSMDGETWDANQLQDVIDHFRKKYTKATQLAARQAEERPWLVQPRATSKENHDSKQTKKAGAVSSLPLTSRPVQVTPCLNEAQTHRSQKTNLPLQLMKPKVAKKAVKTIDLEVLSKNIPKPQKIRKQITETMEDRPRQIQRPNTSFALDFGSLAQPVTDRLEHSKQERASNAVTNRSRSASSQARACGAEIRGREMNKSAEPKLTVSPSMDSQRGPSKYDLPRQIEIIRPTSILKSSNSPRPNGPQKQVVISNLLKPRKNDQFLVTFSKKGPILANTRNHKTKAFSSNKEASSTNMARSTSPRTSVSGASRKKSSPQFKKVTDLLRENEALASPTSRKRSSTPTQKYSLKDARKQIKVQNTSRSRTPRPLQPSGTTRNPDKQTDGGPQAIYLPLFTNKLIPPFPRSQSHNSSSQRKPLRSTSTFDNHIENLRSKSVQPRKRSPSPEGKQKKIDNLIKNNLRKQASLDKLRQEKEQHHSNLLSYRKLELENKNKVIRESNARNNKSDLSTISVPLTKRNNKEEGTGDLGFKAAKESRTYRLGLEIFEEGKGIVSKRQGRQEKEIKTDRSQKRAVMGSYTTQDKQKKKESLNKALKEQMERKIHEMKKAQKNGESQKLRVQLNLKKLESKIATNLKVAKDRSKSRGGQTERPKSRGKSRPRSTNRGQQAVKRTKKGEGRSPDSVKSVRSRSNPKIPRNDKIKQIILNQQKILYNSKNTSSLKALALNLLDLSEQQLKTARVEKVMRKERSKSSKKKSGKKLKILELSEDSRKTPELCSPYANHKGGIKHNQEELESPYNPPLSHNSARIIDLPLQIFGNEGYPMKINQNRNYSSITMGNDRIERAVTPAQILLSPKDSEKAESVDMVLNYAARVIQLWFRKYQINKKENRVKQLLDLPEAEATQDILHVFQHQKRSPEKYFEEFKNFKYMIDEEIMNNDKLIEEIQNTDSKNQVKNTRLFETSEKSILVSIQKSRKLFLSQVNSSHGGYGSSRGSKDLTRRREVPSSASGSEGGRYQQAPPMPTPMLDGQSPASEAEIDLERNPFQQVVAEKTGPIKKEEDETTQLNFDMKQFEVESLNDFVQELSREGNEYKHEEARSGDRVQYVSSLRSIEAQDFLGGQSSSVKSQSQHNQQSEKEFSNSINISHDGAFFGMHQQTESIDDSQDGPSSKFLQQTLNRLSHLQIEQNNDPSNQDISQLSFLNQAKQLFGIPDTANDGVSRERKSVDELNKAALSPTPHAIYTATSPDNLEAQLRQENLSSRILEDQIVKEVKSGNSEIISKSESISQVSIYSQQNTKSFEKSEKQSLKSYNNHGSYMSQNENMGAQEEMQYFDQNNNQSDQSDRLSVDSDKRLQQQIDNHRLQFEKQMKMLGQEIQDENEQIEEQDLELPLSQMLKEIQNSKETSVERSVEPYQKEEIQSSSRNSEALKRQEELEQFEKYVVQSHSESRQNRYQNQSDKVKSESSQFELDEQQKQSSNDQTSSRNSRVQTVNSLETISHLKNTEDINLKDSEYPQNDRESGSSPGRQYQHLHQFPIIKTPLSSSLQKHMMQFENEQSLDKVSHLSKSEQKSQKPSFLGQGVQKLLTQKDYEAMYKTQPVVVALSPTYESAKARILFSRSINAQDQLDSLRNEKWPRTHKTDQKEKGSWTQSRNKSVSSFYLETMQIISKVNDHVKLIKENMNMPRSGAISRESEEGLRSLSNEEDEELSDRSEKTKNQANVQSYVSPFQNVDISVEIQDSAAAIEVEDIRVSLEDKFPYRLPPDDDELANSQKMQMAIQSVEDQVVSSIIEAEIQSFIQNLVQVSSEPKVEEEDISLLKNILSNEKEEKQLHVPSVDRALEVLPQQISMKQQLIQQELDELQKQQEEETRGGQLIAGIDTSLETVESYIEDIFAQIRERGPQFLNAFLTPIYKDPIEQLHLLQKAQLEYQLNGSSGFSGQNLLQNFEPNSSLLCILNVQLYLTLEKEREQVIKEAIEQIKMQSEEEINEEELAEMISEADHIHNKAIFDCVNEAMNQARPYGVAGEPMPWTNTPRKNVFLMIEDNIESVTNTLEKVLIQVKEQVLKWASTCAGSINTTHHQTDLQNMLKKEGIQEKEIEYIIRQEIKASDDKDWQGLDENLMGQVKMELADKVTDMLMQEAVDILNEIENSRR